MASRPESRFLCEATRGSVKALYFSGVTPTYSRSSSIYCWLDYLLATAQRAAHEAVPLNQQPQTNESELAASSAIGLGYSLVSQKVCCLLMQCQGGGVGGWGVEKMFAE